MTQAEVDAKLGVLKEHYAEERYLLNSEIAARRASLHQMRQSADEAYNQALIDTQQKLNAVMNERLTLKSQGLEAFAPAMQDNYNAERNLQGINRANKEAWKQSVWSIRTQNTELQLESERRHKELRKQHHEAVRAVYEEYHNQSMTQADAYAKVLTEQQPES